MKLSFENVGKVAKAEIEVDSITVIAGANDTGKSTAGKILYSIYTALYELTPEKLLRNKVESIQKDEQRILDWLEYEAFEFPKPAYERYFSTSDYVYPSDDDHESHENFLNTRIKEWVEMVKERLKDENISKGVKKQIEDSLQNVLVKADIRSNSEKIKLLTVQDVLLSEFSSSLTTELCANASSKIVLKEDNGNKMKFYFLANEIDDKMSHIEKSREFSYPLYIDNPFVLDELNRQRRNVDSFDHNDKIIELIEKSSKINAFEKMFENKKIREILESVVEGRIVRKGWRYQYQTKKMLNPVDIESLSTGMKSFAVLKMLFDSQKLDKCEFLILDEPEVHLHPEWQLKYAELVVLLASERNVRVLITTHSPYFIEAIELYSKKYGINEHIRYYIAANSKNDMSEMMDVTRRLEILYENMSEPFQTLKELRDELDEA